MVILIRRNQLAERILHESFLCIGGVSSAEGGFAGDGGKPAVLPQRRLAEQPVAQRGDRGNLEEQLGQARADLCRLIIRFASRQVVGTLACRKKLLDHLQLLEEGVVLTGHISLKILLDVVGNAEYHLATAQDFCYFARASIIRAPKF